MYYMEIHARPRKFAPVEIQQSPVRATHQRGPSKLQRVIRRDPNGIKARRAHVVVALARGQKAPAIAQRFAVPPVS